MRKHMGFAIGLSLLFLAPASGAALDLSADPLWRALGIGSSCNAAPRLAAGIGGESGIEAECTASCGTSTVSCSIAGTCTAVDRNCSAGERGHVTCGSTTTYCPTECGCRATALCGSTTVSCTGSAPASCTAVDQNCPAGERGYVTCGSTTTLCPTTCPIVENCNQYDFGSCDYSWDPVRLCCVAGEFCPDTCSN